MAQAWTVSNVLNREIEKSAASGVLNTSRGCRVSSTPAYALSLEIEGR